METIKENEIFKKPDIPVKKIKRGQFLVLRTDMIDYSHPVIWKIQGPDLLQKFIPFSRGNFILYINTTDTTHWGVHLMHMYYLAPVSIVCDTEPDQIVQFFIDIVIKEHNLQLETVPNTKNKIKTEIKKEVKQVTKEET